MASFNPYSRHQRNNVSKKMIQSKMLQTRKGITYNNSRTFRIYQQIHDGNVSNNKSLMVHLGLNSRNEIIYDLYYNRALINETDSIERENLVNMREQVLNSLNDNEKKDLGLIPRFDNEELLEAKKKKDAEMLANPDYIFYCKMVRHSTRYNLVITNVKKNMLLIPEKKYIFNLEDESNFGFQLSFSNRRNEYKDIKGLYFIGTPGDVSGNAFLIYTPEENKPEYQIYAYNKLDFTSNSFSIFAYIYESFTINVTYKAIHTNEIQVSYNTIKCLERHSDIETSELKGPKSVLTKHIDRSGIRNGLFFYTFDINKQYGFYYGKYRVFSSDRKNPFTILNKGIEDKIRISGGGDETKMTTYQVTGIDGLDGSYNFYYGDFYIDVFEDFGTCAFYSYIYGLNSMEDFFTFSDACIGNTYTVSYEEFSDVSNNHLLFPQSNIKFDLSGNMFFNNDISYDSTRKYVLDKGQYIIQDIPIDHPIAFINKGKIPHFEYYGSPSYKKRRLGPDGNIYDFYYGSIVIRVYGDFKNMTIYDYYNGYSGGYELFIYNDDTIDISDTYSDISMLYPKIVSTGISDTIYTELSGNFDISNVNSYIPNDINNVITFDTSNIYLEGVQIPSSTKYGLNTGHYVIRDVPESIPLAFLNYGMEDQFSYDGYMGYEMEGIAPDGNLYKYYYGNINITVTDDFGFISYVAFGDSDFSRRGYNKIIYSKDASNGLAIVSHGKQNYFPELCDDFTDVSSQTYKITVDFTTVNVMSSFPVPYFTFNGYDRKGKLSDTETNPTLTFCEGDVVEFDFADDLNTSVYPFGIFKNNLLLQNATDINPFDINNNANTNNADISWAVNNPSQTCYFYRANTQDLRHIMFGSIHVLQSYSRDLIPNILSFTPESNSVISVTIPTLSITSDKLLIANPNLHYYFVDASNEIISFSGTTITGSGTKTLTFNTYMDDDNLLYYDMSYDFIFDDQLFRTFCGRDLSMAYYDLSYASLDVSQVYLSSYNTESFFLNPT